MAEHVILFPCRRAANGCARPPSILSPVPQSPKRRRGPHRPVVAGEIPMGVGAEYRDEAGEIGRKYGDTLIGTLRTSGSRFARGCTDNEKLSEGLPKLDEPSLFKLVRDHKAGMLAIRLVSALGWE
jgi:hypothetical protein